MARRALGTLLVALVIGCGASAVRERPVGEVLAPRATVDPCAGLSGLALEVPDEIPAEFDGTTITGGRAEVVVRWCGAGTVAVRTMTVVDEREPLARAEHAFGEEGTLAHGAALRREISAPASPTSLDITVVASTSDAAELTASARSQSTQAARYLAEEADCVARGGNYAPAGMAQHYFCDAPTHDAGRRCLSNADCESMCLEDHVEAGAVAGAPTCAAGEELRVHVGTCAARTMHFGCHARLDEPRAECVRPGAMAAQRVICSD